MCKGAVHAEESRVMKSWRRPYTEGVLTEEELQQYWEEGFVIKEGLLPKEQLENVKNAINRCAFFIDFHALLTQTSRSSDLAQCQSLSLCALHKMACLHIRTVPVNLYSPCPPRHTLSQLWMCVPADLWTRWRRCCTRQARSRISARTLTSSHA